MKCYECNWSCWYDPNGDQSAYVRFCDKATKFCRDAYPDECPYMKAEREYAERLEAYRRRYSMGIKEYYAMRSKAGKNPVINDSAGYAQRFAGPEPQLESVE